MNIREKPDADSKKTGSLAYNDPNKYTIVQTKKNGSDTWGKIKEAESDGLIWNIPKECNYWPGSNLRVSFILWHVKMNIRKGRFAQTAASLLVFTSRFIQSFQ